MEVNFSILHNPIYSLSSGWFIAETYMYAFSGFQEDDKNKKTPENWSIIIIIILQYFSF